MGFCADDFFPILRVIVAARHNNANFLFPRWAQFQNFAVDFHGDGAGIGNNHCLACQQIGAVFFVMGNNIFTQGLNGRVCPQHTLHLPQHFFAFLNGVGVCLLLQNIISGVNQRQRVLVQLQVDNTALIIHGTGSTVLDRLGHIVNVDIIAKYFAGVAVFGGNWSACKANKSCIGQGVMDNTRIAYDCVGFFFALRIFSQNNLFIKAILPAMGFVGHDYNIPALGQRTLAALKLEHRGKDNSVCRAIFQQLFQVFLAFSLHRCLPQERRALAELGEQLIVKVDAVGHNNNGGAVQGFLKQMGIEHHGQRLAAALRVPKYTAFAVRAGGYNRAFNGLAHSEILMISCQNLYRFLRVAGE